MKRLGLTGFPRRLCSCTGIDRSVIPVLPKKTAPMISLHRIGIHREHRRQVYLHGLP